MRKTSLTAFVVSDATGRTADSVVRSVLTQFPAIEADVLRFSHVQSAQQVTAVVREAVEARGLIIYSLVDRDLRRLVEQLLREEPVLQFDLLGPIIGSLSERYQMEPVQKAGLLRHVHESSLEMARAIEFTLRHDDGIGLETLNEADLLLLGVSRTSKTPTSVYLACNHSLRVANVPILPDQPLPVEVSHFPKARIGFTIETSRLLTLRRARLRGDIPGYVDPSSVRRDVRHALSVLGKLSISTIINVTNLAIEEISRQVLESINGGRRPAASG